MPNLPIHITNITDDSQNWQSNWKSDFVNTINDKQTLAKMLDLPIDFVETVFGETDEKNVGEKMSDFPLKVPQKFVKNAKRQSKRPLIIANFTHLCRNSTNGGVCYRPTCGKICQSYQRHYS